VVDESTRKGLEINRMKSSGGVLEEPDQSNLQYYGERCCSGGSRSIYIFISIWGAC